MCLSRAKCACSSAKNGDPVGPGVAPATSPMVTVVPSVTMPRIVALIVVDTLEGSTRTGLAGLNVLVPAVVPASSVSLPGLMSVPSVPLVNSM